MNRQPFFALWSLFLVILVAACAQLGVPAADTFNKRALAAYTTVEGINKTATSLKAAGKLSDSDRENIISTSRSAVAGIDLARQVHATNPQGGEDKLTAMIAVLTALQTYLATKEK